MEIKQEHVIKYGLIGRNIGYSFSRNFFNTKFKKERINAEYINLDCKDVEAVKSCLADTSIYGYNVTIPYKEVVIPLLDTLDDDAKAIGAVNTIRRMPDGTLRGYNTDFMGFRASLFDSTKEVMFKETLRKSKIPFNALVLGTGGASKAIVYALTKMGVKSQYISRKRSDNTITYTDINKELITRSKLIINCTPLGTYPDIDQCPDIPFDFISDSHIAYDLIYNPSETVFLKKASKQGATTFNGLPMLEGQALAAWDIWQS